ncbi:MAG: hypothetical protein EA398_11325 [Deltaproteobacteria bacterium]|nr:MAG: hypothetical protein EA398_11325 [Deltaproteobacteria bacterium]
MLRLALPLRPLAASPTVLFVALLLPALGACDRDRAASDDAVHTLPTQLEIPDAAALHGIPAPLPEPDTVACADDGQCRAWRPSAWGPRVECCYEFGCGLDFEALHTDQWALLRAWREANPVDCSEELHESGSCAINPPACPFDTSPPPTRCVDGRCALALPDPWPVVADEAQTCSVGSDCVAVHGIALSSRGRCCAGGCDSPWHALARETVGALEDWLDTHAPSCAEVQEALQCEPATRCAGEPPGVRCADGFCVLE